MPEIEWDDDSYPTEESSAEMGRLFPSQNGKPEFSAELVPTVAAFLRDLPRQMEPCHYARCWISKSDEDDELDLNFVTGGWSGAEEIIGTIWHSWPAFLMSLRKRWERGGLYVISIRGAAP